VSSISQRELVLRKKLRDDFDAYSRACMKIRTKAGDVQAFRPNRSQRYLHERLQKQLSTRGKVRALVLKGRQVGISTYIAARFYWRISHKRGVRAFILTHLDTASDNLFGIAKRYHDNCPELVKPQTGRSNAKELVFSVLDSGYKVATAGSAEVGRSETIQFFHGCLSPDTFIIDGNDHLRRMDEFEIGDTIRTHTGQLAQISYISHQQKPAYDVVIKGMRQMPLQATAEHRFMTSTGWRELADIEPGDCLMFPVPTIENKGIAWPVNVPDRIRAHGGGKRAHVAPEYLEPTYELGRLLGFYLAEGCITKQAKDGEPCAVVLSVHEDVAIRTAEWLDKFADFFSSYSVAPRKDSKTVAVTVYGRSFAKFVLNRCGELDGKRFPSDWKQCGEEFAKGMIHGYLYGDGHSSKRAYDRRISASSIRPAITIAMRDALASLGYGWPSVEYYPERKRYGKPCRPVWILRLSGQGVDRLCSEMGWEMPERKRTGNYGDTVVQDGYAYVKIVSIEDIGEIDVMDFEIDHDDHSYCTVHAATHNSEVAFWPNAQNHSAGIRQAIAQVDGTEDIRESTANGIGNAFHAEWKAAERGDSEYEPIFIPWFWHEEYETKRPSDWFPSEAWVEYQRAYGLTDDQLYWGWLKNRELAITAGGTPDEPCWQFKQEYPANADEAFQTSGDESFIKPEVVLRARKAKASPYGPIILGVDPARGGGDKTGIIDRQGRLMGANVAKIIDMDDLMAVAGEVQKIVKDINPAKVVIDVTGLGAGLYDRLKETIGDKVEGVNFGSKAYDHEAYANRRTEMWDELRKWFDDPAGVQVPDRDDLQGDLCAPVRGKGATHFKSNGQLQLESKDHIKERLTHSPDLGDAAALTFGIEIDPEATKVDDPYSVGMSNSGGWLSG